LTKNSQNQTETQNISDSHHDGKGKPSLVPRRKILFVAQNENIESPAAATDAGPSDIANLASSLSRQKPHAQYLNSAEVVG
jgi:hypothetical protein